MVRPQKGPQATPHARALSLRGQSFQSPVGDRLDHLSFLSQEAVGIHQLATEGYKQYHPQDRGFLIGRLYRTLFPWLLQHSGGL